MTLGIRYFTPLSSLKKVSSSLSLLNCSSGSTTPKQGSHRRVRFRVSSFTYIEAPIMLDVPLNNDELFYTRDELSAIKAENRSITICMQEDIYCRESNDIASPARGLESQTLEGSRQRFWSLRNTARSVMREQERQREEGTVDTDALAEIYGHYASSARYEAYQRGLKDAMVAKLALRVSDFDSMNHEDRSLSLNTVLTPIQLKTQLSNGVYFPMGREPGPSRRRNEVSTLRRHERLLL